MGEPTQTCRACNRVVVVTPDGRGFPPGIAKRKLAKLCTAAGHDSDPVYRAGVSPELERLIAAVDGTDGETTETEGDQ